MLIVRASDGPRATTEQLREALVDHEFVAVKETHVGSLLSSLDVLIPGRMEVDAAVLGQMKRCRLIQHMGAGVDNIDIEKAHQRGISVFKSPGKAKP